MKLKEFSKRQRIVSMPLNKGCGRNSCAKYSWVKFTCIDKFNLIHELEQKHRYFFKLQCSSTYGLVGTFLKFAPDATLFTLRKVVLAAATRGTQPQVPTDETRVSAR